MSGPVRYSRDLGDFVSPSTDPAFTCGGISDFRVLEKCLCQGDALEARSVVRLTVQVSVVDLLRYYTQYAILGVRSLISQQRRIRTYMYICMHIQIVQVIQVMVYGEFLGWFCDELLFCLAEAAKCCKHNTT
jgi:hypothetical protein